MCLYSVSANQLDQFDMTSEEIESYEKVRKAMNAADKPSSTKQHNTAGATPVANRRKGAIVATGTLIN